MPITIVIVIIIITTITANLTEKIFFTPKSVSIIIWTNMENRNLVSNPHLQMAIKSIHHLNDTKRTWRRIIITNVKRVINNNNMYTTASTPHPTNNDSHNHHRGKRKSRLYSTSLKRYQTLSMAIQWKWSGGNNLTSNYPSLHHGYNEPNC